MVVIMGVFVMRWWGGGVDPALLEKHMELASFSFFMRGKVQQVVTFFARQTVKRVALGERRTVEQDAYVCHAWVSSTGLAVAVVTDAEYPMRVAHSVGALCLREFRSAHPDTEWAQVHEDVHAHTHTPALHDLLARYQHPEQADNMLGLQRDLDDITDILRTSLHDLLQRGERLDAIVGKSEDLDAASKQFLWKAQKSGACCSYG